VAVAFIALGSNLSDRVAMLAAALAELSLDARVCLRVVSHVYGSEPWGVADQPSFANAAVALEFAGGPEDLLQLCRAVERRLGRAEGPRNGPRSIDLDILLFDSLVIDTPQLTLPHPRMRDRDFVVTPLLEIEPTLMMPDGRKLESSEATSGRITGVLGVIPGLDSLTPDAPRL